MRVLVTGASGNVGTSVLRALAEDRSVNEIVGLARRLPSRSFAKTKWRQTDVSRDELAPLFKGADAVIPLAWLIQPSRDESLTRRVNVEGSARVFEAVARAGVPALVYASSVGAYAPGPGERPVDESWPATGIASSFYARHKAEVEGLLDRFEAEHADVRSVRLRPALTFKRDAATGIRRLFMGPLLPNRLVRPGMLPVLPYPRGLRTQEVHSLDVGEAYRLAATRPVTGAFNIASEPILDEALIGEVLGARTVGLAPAIDGTPRGRAGSFGCSPPRRAGWTWGCSPRSWSPRALARSWAGSPCSAPRRRCGNCSTACARARASRHRRLIPPTAVSCAHGTSPPGSAPRTSRDEAAPLLVGRP